ncbi:MAG: helix-turn-helix domain-containing protein [Parvibaculaceae bacterium]
MRGGLSIGELSDRTGCKVQTIRYYEQIGLLPPPPRTEGRQRRYGPTAEQRLSFIRHARALGFDIEAIRRLLDLAGHPENPCAEIDRIAALQLAAVEEKINRLSRLKSELERMIQACGQGPVAECRVLETLADHGHCASREH